MEIGASPSADIPSIPAQVPGSVQLALFDAGLIPDWNHGTNSRLCEWVENRHWVYEAIIPDEWVQSGQKLRLRCLGLDGFGSLFFNGVEISQFRNSHLPVVLDLTEHWIATGNCLRFVFEDIPRWLGQFGYTSRMTEWKTRFNYTWDWTVRLVQIGIHEPVLLDVGDGVELGHLWVHTQGAPLPQSGSLRLSGHVASGDGFTVRVRLSQNDREIESASISVAQFNAEGLHWDILSVRLWWPNGCGPQPLYDLLVELVDDQGCVVDQDRRRVGFKDVVWQACKNAPKEADPWICVVNGNPVFLQGFNWVPPLPNFADTSPERYRKLLEVYRDLGANIVRVWGGATLERQLFYDICDELGLLVWQEFPLSSSGIDNYPPDDADSIETLARIAESYIERRHHHACLLMWCGGNELQGANSGPCNIDHPALRRMGEVCRELDPTHRYVPTSASGPTFGADAGNFGKGLHWDVHGPWRQDGDIGHWQDYWAKDDALLRSETGAPGTSSAEMIRQYAGECDTLPVSASNPLWRRTSVWWIEWDQYVVESGTSEPNLDAYVAWNQERQKQALITAAEACKNRFPECGGFIVWMGHDCFPCTANTAVIDFNGVPKPAGLALGEIFKRI